jgi:hypothetical protein
MYKIPSEYKGCQQRCHGTHDEVGQGKAESDQQPENQGQYEQGQVSHINTPIGL